MITRVLNRHEAYPYKASLNIWYRLLLTKLKTNHELVSSTILRPADHFSRVIPFQADHPLSPHSFVSCKGSRSCLSWSIPSPNIMRYSPFMICWSSIWRVCTARPGWSLAVRLIRWIERRPSTTAATSSSSRKMTRLVCSITALQNGQGDVISNQGENTLKHQLSSCQCLRFL